MLAHQAVQDALLRPPGTVDARARIQDRTGGAGGQGAPAGIARAAGGSSWRRGAIQIHARSCYAAYSRAGDDRYCFTQALPEGDWPGTPPLGSTTRYEPTGTFRDDLPVYGIFLDTGGRDDYSGASRGADDTIWEMNRYPHAYGLGMDCGSGAPK
jgi:hypothetical protein